MLQQCSNNLAILMAIILIGIILLVMPAVECEKFKSETKVGKQSNDNIESVKGKEIMKNGITMNGSSVKIKKKKAGKISKIDHLTNQPLIKKDKNGKH